MENPIRNKTRLHENPDQRRHHDDAATNPEQPGYQPRDDARSQVGRELYQGHRRDALEAPAADG